MPAASPTTIRSVPTTRASVRLRRIFKDGKSRLESFFKSAGMP
jgi:hypothetical protein